MAVLLNSTKLRICFAILLYVFIVISDATESNLNSLEGKVKNGQLVASGSMTYIASIRLFKKHLCGGSFITLMHIVSVARCTYKIKDKTIKGKILKTNYDVYAGSVHRKLNGAPLKIIDVEINPEFNPSQVDSPGNIGILLVQDVSQNPSLNGRIDHISPSEEDVSDGLTATLAGWAVRTVRPLMQHFEKEVFLKESEMTVVSNEHCKLQNNQSVDGNYICAQRIRQNELPQAGNAGSPLVHENQIVGLFSFITNKVWGYGVYTRVYKYLQFIEDAKETLVNRNKKQTSKINFSAAKKIFKKHTNNLRNKFTKKDGAKTSETA